MIQTLIIENFPRPEIARVLGPNGGRAHWAVARKARLNVIDHVTVAAIKQSLRQMRGFVVLEPLWIYPDHRQRDGDNLATGVMKAAIDTLVNGGWLVADDVAHLCISPPVVLVDKRRRALELRFESTEPAA